MINTDYNSMYGQFLKAGGYGKTKGKATDSGKDLTRQMANSFLNQMVFSHMGTSKELFVPQMSRTVLSAAFGAAYDYSDMAEKIRNSGDEDTAKDSDAAENAETEQ